MVFNKTISIKECGSEEEGDILIKVSMNHEPRNELNRNIF